VRVRWRGLLAAISLAEESNRDDRCSFNEFDSLKLNEKTTDYCLETAEQSSRLLSSAPAVR
jgi:hypothetical protein